MSLVSPGTPQLGSRVCDTLQGTGRNYTLRAQDALGRFFCKHERSAFYGEAQVLGQWPGGSGGRQSVSNRLSGLPKNLNQGRWQGRCEAVPGPL